MKRALVVKEFHVKKSLNCIVNSVEIKFPIPIFFVCILGVHRVTVLFKS